MERSFEARTKRCSLKAVWERPRCSMANDGELRTKRVVFWAFCERPRTVSLPRARRVDVAAPGKLRVCRIPNVSRKSIGCAPKPLWGSIGRGARELGARQPRKSESERRPPSAGLAQGPHGARTAIDDARSSSSSCAAHENTLQARLQKQSCRNPGQSLDVDKPENALFLMCGVGSLSDAASSWPQQSQL